MLDVRRIRDPWRRCDVTLRDLPFALLLGAASLLPALDSHGTVLGTVPTRPVDALAVVAVSLQAGALALTRRWPAVCLALVLAGFSLDQLRGYHSIATLALPVALLSAGAHVERHRRTVALLATAGFAALAGALSLRGRGEGGADFITFYLFLAVCWGAGSWLRMFRAAEAERRGHVAETTRAAERARIAGELHDVVTHHVTAMVVQTESARYLTGDPERLDQTLAAVTDTGRRAISDLRTLLDLLNPEHSAEPPRVSSGELDTLVEQTRQAGQPVEFTQDGTRQENTGSAEIALYRVVQEALTNALKYDHGSPTLVHVRYRPREITVEIATDGSGSRAGTPGGSGRGLTGLRERVGVLGGDFTAGRRPGGGFVVQARIPAGSMS